MIRTNYIDRPPRIQPELPSGTFEVPNPPNKEQNANSVLLQGMLPLVTIVGYVIVSVMGKGRNLLMLIPMGIAVVASVLLGFYSNKRQREITAAKDTAYLQRLGDLRQSMESSHSMQRIYYNSNYPEPELAVQIAFDLNRTSDKKQEELRSGTRLWERRPNDADFAVARLGTGIRPSSVLYQMKQGESFEDPLVMEAIRLCEDSLYVSDVPITVPLRVLPPKEGEQESADYARYSIGICGQNHEGVYQYVWGMLVDYTAFQSPTDTRLYIIGSYQARENWRWAFTLPHCKETAQTDTLCFEEEQERRSEKDIDRVLLFWKNLRNTLERRKLRLSDKESGGDVTLPFMLIIVDTLAPLPEWSALRDLESEAAVSLILSEGDRLGAAILFLVPERNKVPSACKAVIEVDVDPKDKNKKVFRYAEVNLNTPRFVGRADLIHNQDMMRDFAKQLEPLQIRRGYGADLATSVTLLEMLGLASLEELQKMSWENWLQSKSPGNSDWLSVPVGLLSGNEARRLTFSAKADGVHGLVAGSTGSGKSELLMTMIIGLALNYDPSVINFVLVDYKGGAAFEPFRHLPHCVDIVTNLEGSGTARMFASIKAELDRRQRLNTYTDSKDIVHYRKKGLHTKDGSPPYPFLFIIIDEFAEMISGNAEFKTQLESITRLGRALGVHLILAAQRPVGVTDQMRANIKFRICLRVETPDDSRELLRRSDAAFLPPGIPGRGYLQVGNENIEMIQTAYTGGDYRGVQENVSPNIIWLNRPKKSDKSKGGEAPKLYDVIVDMCDRLSKQEYDKPQWRPWPAFLPRVMNLQTNIDLAYMSDNDIAFIRGAAPVALEGETPGTVEVEQAQTHLVLNPLVSRWYNGEAGWKGISWSQYAMRPAIGVIDNPYDARQMPLIVNFPTGHAVMFGASGWGKTTFIRTVIASLTATHSPDELHIYILDFGGRNLILFRDLPHVGAVITSDEEERVQRLIRKLSSILEKRQSLLSEAGVTDLYTYNTKFPDKILPAILVVIDNFAEFKENYDGLMGDLISLVRDARAYGIHFLVTADQPNAMSGKLFSVFTERMTLKLTDAGEYTNVVGRGVPDISAIPGRGYVRVGRTPLEFQIAMPIGMESDDSVKGIDETEKLKHIGKIMSETWARVGKGALPASIETLPTRILLEKIIAMRPAVPTKRLQPVVGVDDMDLAPFFLDLQRQGPHLLIIGPANSGKTTALRNLVLSMAYTYGPEDFMMVLIDFQRKFYEYGGKHSLAEIPQVVQVINKPEQLDELDANLQVECKDLVDHPGRKKIFILIDNYDSFGDEGYRKSRKAIDDMAILAREYSTGGLSFVISGSMAVTSVGDDLKKQIISANYGLALQSVDAVNKLNGKVARSMADVELPAGRSFFVKSGRTAMLQLATPYSNDENVEGSLDSWVEQIIARHPKGKAAWLKPPTPVTPTANGTPIAPAATAAEIEAFKAQLRQKGMADNLLAVLSNADILKMAADMGLTKPAADSAKK